MGIGDVFYGELILTNYGLVRADHVKQQLPSSDGLFRYEFLVDVPATMEAKQRVTIPYRVVALKSLEASASTASASGGGCYNYSNVSNVKYDYTCANHSQSSGNASAFWFSGSNSSCPGGTGVGVGGYGGGGSGGFGGEVSKIGTKLPGGHWECRKVPKGGGASCS
jgi:hypothetical protein